MNKLKVCWLSLSISLRSTIGSTDKLELPRHLALKGHQVYLFCLGCKNTRPNEEFFVYDYNPFFKGAPYIRIFNVILFNPISNISENIGLLIRVLQISRKISFDVLVANPELSFASTLLSKLLRIPLVTDFRTPMAMQALELSQRKILMKIVEMVITKILETIAVKASSRLIAITPNLKEYLIRHHKLPYHKISLR